MFVSSVCRSHGGVGIAPAMALPEGTFSANTTFVTDYRFRGISQSAEHGAVQLGGLYNQPLNESWSVYAGGWMSNVDFMDNHEAEYELDGYSGFAYAKDDWTFDVGGIYYAYPGANSGVGYDYYEFQMNGSYAFDDFTLLAATNYSPDYFGHSGHSLYSKAGVKVPLPQDITLAGTLSYIYIDDRLAFGVPSYAQWGIGITRPFYGVDVGLEYQDTNLTRNECADGCDAVVLFSLSKSF